MKKLFIILIMALVTSVAHAEKFVTHVTLTTYNAVKSQCDDTPLITADGTKIDVKKLKKGTLKYAAVSRDLLWCIPLGSLIHIEGHGYYEVRDTMNERFDHYIDILQHSSKKNFKKDKVRVEVIRKPKKKA
jgi:3D (Asp-Asp-Asp) domain-containing protein